LLGVLELTARLIPNRRLTADSAPAPATLAKTIAEPDFEVVRLLAIEAGVVTLTNALPPPGIEVAVTVGVTSTSTPFWVTIEPESDWTVQTACSIGQMISRKRVERLAATAMTPSEILLT